MGLNMALKDALTLDAMESTALIYSDDLKEEKFIVPEIASKHYPTKDFHRFYMGEIVKVLSR